MKKVFKFIAKSFAAVILFLLLIGAAAELYKATQGNFHSVTEGEFYRSAQLDKDNFEHYIKLKGIKTIINLRGEAKGAPWYEEELAVSQEYNVTHIDFPMTAYDDLNISRAEKIVALMKSGSKPILVHCHGGADRSALISSLWLLGVKHLPESEAKEQFKLIYGYFPYLMWEKKKALEASFNAYVGALREYEKKR